MRKFFVQTIPPASVPCFDGLIDEIVSDAATIDIGFFVVNLRCEKVLLRGNGIRMKGTVLLMNRITVCVGSACYMKGSRQVVALLQHLIEENGLSDEYELEGTFCTGNCQHGVCVEFGGRTYSLTPDNTEEFFRTEILKTP